MTTAIVVVSVVAALLGVVALIWWLSGRGEPAPHPLPPLFYPMTSEPRESLGMAAHWGEQRAARVAPVDPPRTEVRRGPVTVVDQIDEDKPAPAETVRFFRPSEEPVQLLPGRLEVLAGEPRHHEIRFVRLPGEPHQLILGRDAGPSRQYVGLSSATVSRRHARFAFADGHWLVKNLSQTNPLVVNDDELSDSDAERALVDGDRLELGEVVLRFHAH